MEGEDITGNVVPALIATLLSGLATSVGNVLSTFFYIFKFHIFIFYYLFLCIL